MNYIIFLALIVSLCIIFLYSFYLFKNRENTKYHKPFFYLIILMLVSLIFILIFILWFFGISKYSATDFLIIFSFLILIKTIALYLLLCPIFDRKRVFVFFILFSLLLFSPLIKIHFSILVISISFLLILFLFIPLYFDTSFKPLALLGLFYSSLSLILHLILFINQESIMFFFIFSEVIFLFFSFNLLKTLQHKQITSLKLNQDRKYLKNSYIIAFLRSFILIIVLSIIVFISTVALHELGHTTISKLYGCNYQRIIYEGGSVYTEILCNELSGNKMVILGGILAPFLAVLLLFFGGGEIVKEIALMIAGFNLTLAYRDFIDLGISVNLAIFSLIFGYLLVIIGIAFLSKSRIEYMEEII
jgi:hypothetical protein